MPNYAFTRELGLPSIENNQVFDGYNLMQAEPHTAIFAGYTGLVFRKCNLLNCDMPGDAIIDDCLHIHKTLCANLHPEWIAKGLPAEIENCPHVAETDTITIDGQVVDTIYHYADTVV